jgi:hypothetical protein
MRPVSLLIHDSSIFSVCMGDAKLENLDFFSVMSLQGTNVAQKTLS